MEHMLREKKMWGHVYGTVAAPRFVLTLGAGVTRATSVVPAIVAAMGVAVLRIAAIAANARVTQVQVDASRVTHDQYAVNEVKANTMILLTLEHTDVMTLLAFP